MALPIDVLTLFRQQTEVKCAKNELVFDHVLAIWAVLEITRGHFL